MLGDTLLSAGQQLLDKEWIAVRTGQQRADQGRVLYPGCLTGNGCNTSPVQRPEFHPDRAITARDLDKGPAERMPTREFVAPVRQHDKQRTAGSPSQGDSE